MPVGILDIGVLFVDVSFTLDILIALDRKMSLYEGSYVE
jgi:hypothetical protein